MMNKLVRSLAIVVMFSFSGVAAAIPALACTENAIDPDGDGWGWENETSCQFNPVAPEPVPVCISAGSDTDGDGWGWENNLSCLVESGASISFPVQVAPGQLIEGTLNSNESNYYRFDVVNASLVGLDTSFEIFNQADVSITGKDDGEVYLAPGADFRLDACLQPGAYILKLTGTERGFVQALDYSINLTTADENCIAPATDLALNDSQLTQYLWQVAKSGDLIATDFSDVVKTDLSGNQLWRRSFNGVFDISSFSDGTVVVVSSLMLNLIGLNGELLWEISLDGMQIPITHTAEQTILLETDNYLIAFNALDGARKWRYDLKSSERIVDIQFIDGGRVVLTIDGSGTESRVFRSLVL